MGLVVAYYRVSTQRQGKSGLGLDAQRVAIAEHCRATGCELLAEFSEVESGRVNARPKLAAACRLARSRRATLVVAKLDRLTRNVAFLSSLMESKVDFLACDMPVANKLTIHILAAVAEYEADVIGQRTKAALQAARARGTLLGSHRPGHWDGKEQQRLDGMAKARKIAAEVKGEDARSAYMDIVPTIRQLRDDGHTLQMVADELNRAGELTREGCRWNPATVGRALRHHGDASARHIDSPLTPVG